MDNQDLDFLEEQPVEDVVEPEVTEVPVEEPVEEVEAKPVMVPLAALHEVRDEVKTLKAKLAEKEVPPVAEQLPDVFEDPNGFAQGIVSNFDVKLHQTKLSISERFARKEFGEELTNSALEWGRERCASDPTFNFQVMQSDDPVGFAVQQFQREQIASQVNPSEYSEFKAWKAAQAQANATPVAPPVEVPQSIANAPSAGGLQHVALGESAIFDDFFKR